MKKNKGSKLKFEDYTVEDAEKEEAEAGSAGKYGKIQPGINRLRILPAREGEKWKVAFYKHFVDVPGVGTVSFICPFHQTKGKRKCRTCLKAKKLEATGDKTDAAKAERLRVQRKVMFNAVNRKDEDSGPKTYEVGRGIEKDLFDIRKVDDVNFQHPTKGCDIIINKTGQGRNLTRYKTKAARDTTPLHEDASVMQDWIMNQPELKVRIESDEDIDAKLRGEDPRDRRDSRRGRDKDKDDDDDDDDEEMDDDDLKDQDDEDEDRSSKKKRRSRDDEDDEDEEIEFD